MSKNNDEKNLGKKMFRVDESLNTTGANTEKKEEKRKCPYCDHISSNKNISRHINRRHKNLTKQCEYCHKVVKNIYDHVKICSLKNLDKIGIKPKKEIKIQNPYDIPYIDYKKFEDIDLKNRALNDIYDEKNEKEYELHNYKVNEYKAKYIYNYNQYINYNEKDKIWEAKNFELIEYANTSNYVRDFYINLANALNYIIKNNYIFYKKHKLSFVEPIDLIRHLMKKIVIKKMTSFINNEINNKIECNCTKSRSEMLEILSININNYLKKYDILFNKMITLIRLNVKYNEMINMYNDRYNNIISIYKLKEEEDKKFDYEINKIKLNVNYNNRLFDEDEVNEINEKIKKNYIINEKYYNNDTLINKYMKINEYIKYIEYIYLDNNNDYDKRIIEHIEKKIEENDEIKKLKEKETKYEKEIDYLVNRWNELPDLQKYEKFDDYIDTVNEYKDILYKTRNEIYDYELKNNNDNNNNNEFINYANDYNERKKRNKNKIFYLQKLKQNLKTYEDILIKLLNGEDNIYTQCPNCNIYIHNIEKHMLLSCNKTINFIMNNTKNGDYYTSIYIVLLFAYTPEKINKLYNTKNIEKNIKDSLFKYKKHLEKPTESIIKKILLIIYEHMKTATKKWVPMKRKDKIKIINEILNEVDGEYINEEYNNIIEEKEKELKEMGERVRRNINIIKQIKEKIYLENKINNIKMNDDDIESKTSEIYESVISTLSFETDKDFQYILKNDYEHYDSYDNIIDFDNLNIRKTYWGLEEDIEYDIDSHYEMDKNDNNNIKNDLEGISIKKNIEYYDTEEDNLYKEIYNKGLSDEMSKVIIEKKETIKNNQKQYLKTKNNIYIYETIKAIVDTIIIKINTKYVNERWGNINEYKNWLINIKNEKINEIKNYNNIINYVPYIDDIIKTYNEEENYNKYKNDTIIYFYYVIYNTLVIYCKEKIYNKKYTNMNIKQITENFYKDYKRDTNAIFKIVYIICLLPLFNLFGWGDLEQYKKDFLFIIKPYDNKKNEIFYPYFPFNNENIMYPGDYNIKIKKTTHVNGYVSKTIDIKEDNINKDIDDIYNISKGPTAIDGEQEDNDIIKLKNDMKGNKKTLVLIGAK